MSSTQNSLSDDDVSHSFDRTYNSDEYLQNGSTELCTAKADLDDSFEIECCHVNNCPCSLIQTSLPCWLHKLDKHGRGKHSYRNLGILFPEVLENSEDVSINPKFKNYELTLRTDLDKGKALWGDNICCDWFINFVNYNPLTQIILHNPLSSLRWDFRVIMCLVYVIYIYITVDFDPHPYQKMHYKFDEEGFKRAHPHLIEEKIRIEERLQELSKEKIRIEDESKKESIEFEETLDKLTTPEDQSWKSRRRLANVSGLSRYDYQKVLRNKGDKIAEKGDEDWKKSGDLQEKPTPSSAQASPVEEGNGEQEQEKRTDAAQTKEEPDEKSGEQEQEPPENPVEASSEQKEESDRSKLAPVNLLEKILIEKLKFKTAIQKIGVKAEKRREEWQAKKQKFHEEAKRLGEKLQSTMLTFAGNAEKSATSVSSDKRKNSIKDTQAAKDEFLPKTLKVELLEEFGKEQAQYVNDKFEMLKTLRKTKVLWKQLVADEENLKKEKYGKEKEIEFKKKNYESWWSETIFPPKSNLAKILSPLFLVNAFLQRTIIAQLAMCKCAQKWHNFSRRTAKMVSRLFLYLYLVGSICLLWFMSRNGWLATGRKSTEFFTTIIWGLIFDLAKSTGLFTYKVCRGSEIISWKHFKAWKNIGFPDMISIQGNISSLEITRSRAQKELGYLNGDAEKEKVVSQPKVSHEELENLLGNFCCDATEIQKMVAELQLNPPYNFEEVRQIFKNLTKNKIAEPEDLKKASLERALKSIEFSEFCPFAYAEEEMEREE